MKKFLCILSFLPLMALALEYKFLTPEVVVLVGEKLPKISADGANIIRTGYWKKENALKRDKKNNILREADITYYLYIVFAEPFKVGERRQLGKIELLYDPDKPSDIFKLNQVGNGINQKRKYAYMGAWLGSLGALPLKSFDGKEFEIRRVLDDKTVFKNVIKMRRDDPFYQGEIPFTGEEVAELDYSDFNEVGEYYFYVKNIGKSMNFSISAETINEAFYIHAKGLFHKRCGIAKNQPYTPWESPACHNSVLQGRFPENIDHYRKQKDGADFGFTYKNKPVEVKIFDLIKEDARANRQEKKYSVQGGWHDAADYDRRPFHLRIVCDLAVLYLLKPENFIDGQFNIPESGNGIPDILDEAAWGLEHLLTVQQDNGGVGTWFETTGHPQAGEGLPNHDKYIYYVSAPSRNGTLEYAAAAGMLAWAMKKAGAANEAEIYLKSAQKAWDFAMNKKNQLVSNFMIDDKLLFYSEGHLLNSENLLKAGSVLYILCGDEKYLTPITAEKKRIQEDFNKNFWKYSALSLMNLELCPIEKLDGFRENYHKTILSNADKMLEDLEKAYPYRTLWHDAEAGWVHAMSWGNYHPLRRAMTLIVAHALTKDEKYLQGAYLANDFHNGANPLGQTMTSGLGQNYPAVFLDLVSYADKQGEFVAGITPYGNTFGMDKNAVKMVYGAENKDKLPIWRRRVNLEFLSVPSSEYSVWETIAPAMVTCGYLIEKPSLPSKKFLNWQVADDFRKLKGYRSLP